MSFSLVLVAHLHWTVTVWVPPLKANSWSAIAAKSASQVFPSILNSIGIFFSLVTVNSIPNWAVTSALLVNTKSNFPVVPGATTFSAPLTFV